MNKSMYGNLIENLREAVEQKEYKLIKSIKATILENFKGDAVTNEVRLVTGDVVSNSTKVKRRVLTFTMADFDKDKKKVTESPTIEIVAEDEEVQTQVGNMWKSILEKTDEELKLKLVDIDTAIDFLNKRRKKLDLSLVSKADYKTMSPKFFKILRATLSLKIKGKG